MLRKVKTEGKKRKKTVQIRKYLQILLSRFLDRGKERCLKFLRKLKKIDKRYVLRRITMI